MSTLSARWKPWKAGASYFALVFAAGFVLGTLRTFFVEPAFGETSAVLLELPFMLIISWIACSWSVHHFEVPDKVGDRCVMGISAVLMLLAAEALLSIGLAGLSLQQHYALYLKPAAQLGLLGQLAFALFPLIQLRFSTSQNCNRTIQ